MSTLISLLHRAPAAVHEKLHDADNTESYPCPECGVKFKNKKTLTGHVKTHSTDKPHKCDSCDSAFTRKASLTRHVLAAHAGHVYHCDICNAPFSYKSTLEDHRRAVHNEGKRDFHCAGCGLSFACKSYLQKHMVSHNPASHKYLLMLGATFVFTIHCGEMSLANIDSLFSCLLPPTEIFFNFLLK